MVLGLPSRKPAEDPLEKSWAAKLAANGDHRRRSMSGSPKVHQLLSSPSCGTGRSAAARRTRGRRRSRSQGAPVRTRPRAPRQGRRIGPRRSGARRRRRPRSRGARAQPGVGATSGCTSVSGPSFQMLPFSQHMTTPHVVKFVCECLPVLSATIFAIKHSLSHGYSTVATSQAR